MTEISLDEGRIKEILKQTLLEVLEGRRDLLYDVLAEAMEDFALAKAIQEGESKESIFRTRQRKASRIGEVISK